MNLKLEKLSRSPIWPALLSALVAPGVGQIFNRDYKRGILLLVIFVGGLFWFSAILTDQLSVFLHTPPETWVQDPVLLNQTLSAVVEKNLDMFVTFFFLIILTWGFSVIDAYLSARKSRKIIPPVIHEDTDSLS